MKAITLQGNQVTPSKIVCIGRNYMEHIEELNNAVPDDMVVFNKPNSSIGDSLLSYHQEALHYEGEICFLIQNGTLFAVGFGLDLTKRELQSQLKKRGLPWERAKAFDGAALFSDFIPLQNIDISQLTVELQINQQQVQLGCVQQMLYPPMTILQQLGEYTSLECGDIIMTGTPKGVGKVVSGDQYTGKISYQGNCLVEVSWIAQ